MYEYWFNYLSKLMLGHSYSGNSLEQVIKVFTDHYAYPDNPTHSWIRIQLPWNSIWIHPKRFALKEWGYEGNYHGTKVKVEIPLTPEQVKEATVYEIYKKL